MIEKDGLRIELLAYSKPGVIGKPPHHRRNHLGLTHLSFFADDIDAAAEAMVEFGGTLVPDTRVGLDDPQAAQYTFVADPDATGRVHVHPPRRHRLVSSVHTERDLGSATPH